MKSSNARRHQVYEAEAVLVAKDTPTLRARLEQYQSNAPKKSKLQHWQKRHIDKFAHFIDNPYCYNKAFLELHHVNSSLKPLQPRQRLALVKVFAALLSITEAEKFQVGVCKNYGMEGATHQSLRRIYETIWGESIHKSRWDRMIKLLKKAKWLDVDACYCLDNEPDENGEYTDRIYSIAAMKTFTATCLAAFGLSQKKDVAISTQRSIADRIRKGLSNIWIGYKSFTKRLTSETGLTPIPIDYDQSLIH